LAFAPGLAPLQPAYTAPRAVAPQLGILALSSIDDAIDKERKLTADALVKLEQETLPALRQTMQELELALGFANSYKGVEFKRTAPPQTEGKIGLKVVNGKAKVIGAKRFRLTQFWSPMKGLVIAVQAIVLVASNTYMRALLSLGNMIPSLRDVLSVCTPKRAALAALAFPALLGMLPLFMPMAELPLGLTAASNWAGSLVVLPFELLSLVAVKSLLSLTGAIL